MKVGEMRAQVYARDGGCVAPRLDPEASRCYDRWGAPLPAMRQRADELEMDYVREGARAGRHLLMVDHVMLCPGHHQGAGPNGGHQWGPAHRRAERKYLAEQHTPGTLAGGCKECRAPVLWHKRWGWVERETWEPHRHG